MGGAGGLLLDTGSGPSFLPLPTPVLEQVAAGNSEPGVTSLKLPDFSHKPSEFPLRETDIEVCFVCKKCRLAFPGETSLLSHQRQCYGANPENRGAFRIVQTGYECKTCNSTDKFKNMNEFRKHLENSPCGKMGSSLPPPSESPLSHEMEDVVNQITLLAARAAKEGGTEGTRVVDSNSNTFCQPAEPKRRFLTPADVPQQITSAGH